MGQPVQGASFLEGCGELKVLELQPHLATEQVRERTAVIEVGDQHGALNDRCRLFDVGEGDVRHLSFHRATCHLRIYPLQLLDSGIRVAISC